MKDLKIRRTLDAHTGACAMRQLIHTEIEQHVIRLDSLISLERQNDAFINERNIDRWHAQINVLRAVQGGLATIEITE